MQVNQMFIRLLYNLLLMLILPIALFKLHWPKKGKPIIGRRWPEHFGWSAALEQPVDLWFHAVSVGEVLASIPLLRELKQRHPHWQLLVTTTTATGAIQVETKLAGIAVHRYAPFDLLPCVHRFIQTHKPKQLWIMETELWPNLIQACHSQSIPVSIINARLSERSAKRYQRFITMTKSLLSHIHHICVQSSDDANRLRRLGYPQEQMTITGSLKYDLTLPDGLISQTREQRRTLFGHRSIWIAASTHKGEDEVLLSIAKYLLCLQPDILLILAPRHPERFSYVSQLIQAQGLTLAHRSKNEQPQASTQVYLADTMGELMTLYGMVDVAFMGGSIVPIGGHNYLEAAALGVPCVSGPYDFNFRDISVQLQKYGALKLCQNKAEIQDAMACWLMNAKEQQKASNAALLVVKSNQGALERCLIPLLNE